MVDASKTCKRTIKYVLHDVYHECLLDYQNITSICFCLGSRSHKFDIASLIQKTLLLSLKSSILFLGWWYLFCNENRTDTQHADWVEVCLKRASRHNRNESKVAGNFNQNDNTLFQGNKGSKMESSMNLPTNDNVPDNSIGDTSQIGVRTKPRVFGVDVRHWASQTCFLDTCTPQLSLPLLTWKAPLLILTACPVQGWKIAPSLDGKLCLMILYPRTSILISFVQWDQEMGRT